MASSTRSFKDALEALNSLQTPHAIVEARRKAGQKPGPESMREMDVYLRRIGYSPADLDRLNVVHVAGTKGKGSTCAFVDSILAQHRRTRGVPRRIGLFTSPHLVSVRERIRIDSKPISEEIFAKYFFEVWDRLGASAAEAAAASGDAEAHLGARPHYGRYLTLMSWHTFLQEGVDVAVYETGIGGEYDATNLVPRPAATGVTSLGIDHVSVLGNTVDKIAWHKAGIFKNGCPAFTVKQLADAAPVLRQRAAERGAPLSVLLVDPRLDGICIRPDAQFQKKNASLAVALAETVLQRLDVSVAPPDEPLSRDFVDGLKQTIFRGRCEVKVEPGVSWFLDGAHTADSLKLSSQWFAQETAGRSGPRVLIFNQQSRSEAVDFLDAMHAAATTSSAPFDHVVFCTNVTRAATGFAPDFVNRQTDPDALDKMTVQRRFAERWSALDPHAAVVIMPTIEEALDHARLLVKDCSTGEKDVLVYVTGSLHLVGGALSILDGSDAL